MNQGQHRAPSSSSGVVIGPRDILFECPSCNKSLVVDEIAEGQVVPCPGCGTAVIVPPKASAQSAPSPPAATVAAAAAPPAQPQPPAEVGSQAAAVAAVGAAQLKERFEALEHKLAELQTQRLEVVNRITARLNEINRDLVLLSRQSGAQQQLNSEYQQLVRELEQVLQKTAQSPSGAGSSRVKFRG